MLHFIERQEERALFDEAYLLAQRVCMRQKGFDWKPAPAPPQDAGIEMRYGPTSVDYAERWGYGPPYRLSAVPISDVPEPADPAAAVALVGAQDPASAVRVLDPFGHEAFSSYREGCVAEAEDWLHGGEWARYQGIRGWLEEVANQGARDSQQTPSVQAAERRWSACMHRAGYDVSDTVAPVEQLMDVTGAAARRQAVADVRCKEEVDYVRIRAAEDGAIQAKLLAAAPAAYGEWERLWEAALDRAREVLAAEAATTTTSVTEPTG
jgi:hypothetical protein